MTYQFPERLSFLLRERGITQSELAERVGKTPQAVGKWLAGGGVNHNTAKSIAKELDVSWVWLAFGDEAIVDAKNTIGRQDRLSILKDLVFRNAEDFVSRETAILVALDIGVWEINFLTAQNYWSPIARDQLEAPLDLQPNQSVFREFVHPDDLPIVDKGIADAIHSGAKYFFQSMRLKAKPGKRILSAAFVVRSKEGTAERIVGLSICDKSDFASRALTWYINTEMRNQN